jgi:prohibitin 2
VHASASQLTFGREYTAAVEAKQVAQQEAERAKFIVRRRSLALLALLRRLTPIIAQVEKAEQDKKSAIIRAEGAPRPRSLS